MRSFIDCMHCYLKQSVSCMQHAGISEDRQYEIIYEIMDYVKGFDQNKSPAENSSLALKKTCELMGIKDPYSKVKRQSNDLALALYPRLRDVIKKSRDKLYEALKVSVAGNIIDLGINRSFDIEEGLRHSLNDGFSVDHYSRFKDLLSDSKDILFIGDNAGEIVFDRLLVEELADMGKKVVYVVKSGPVLNDSTMEDAVYTGMKNAARVITSGSSFLGTSMDRISQELKELLETSRIIIAKGQANFETLETCDFVKDKLFFLLKLKCEEVARAAGGRFGDVVFFTK